MNTTSYQKPNRHDRSSSPRPPLRGGFILMSLAASLFMSAGVQAQIPAGSHELHVYAGHLYGDNLTKTGISGRTPKLGNNVTFGARYGYNFTSSWGAELSVGETLGKVKRLPSDDIDLNLTTVECAVVRHFSISAAPRWIPYVTAGAGYAFTDLDHPIRGNADGRTVSIDGDNGFTVVAGTGVKYMLTNRLMLRSDVRYRYIDKLTDSFDRGLNTVEATVGLGWRI